MDAAVQESYLKKKLQNFLSEMLKMGSVKGFKHFATYLRGREEMVISIVNQPQTHHLVHSAELLESNKAMGQARRFSLQNSSSPSNSLTSKNLPYDKRKLLISMRSQMNLNITAPAVGLPPASPSDQEIQLGDENSTLFLIAGYGRYNCPYVWVRSHHERLIKLTGDSTRDKDSPLRLKTTSQWKDNDFYIWDIIAELIKLCTYPSPVNPFEVDFDYFTTLSLPEQVLASAAMVNFLQKIILHSPDEKQFSGRVFEELQLVSKLHFTYLQNLINNQQLPILQQHLQAASRQRSSSGSSRNVHYRGTHYSSTPVSSNYGYNSPTPHSTQTFGFSHF